MCDRDPERRRLFTLFKYLGETEKHVRICCDSDNNLRLIVKFLMQTDLFRAIIISLIYKFPLFSPISNNACRFLRQARISGA